MTLRIRAKVLLHVWSYDFYGMTLSTEKKRRDVIKCFLLYFSMNYRDFSVKSKLIISLFQTVKLSLSISLFQKI